MLKLILKSKAINKHPHGDCKIIHGHREIFQSPCITACHAKQTMN